MLIIPAIDLKDGKCVRLFQGRADAVTVFSDDPIEIALRWQSLGARLIHVVDLDGAFSGNQKNIEIVKKIREHTSAEIELGGGIRDLQRIEMLLKLGINRVILGTVAIEKPEFVQQACRLFPDRIIVSIDAKNEFVSIKGWVELTDTKAEEFALRMQDYGVWGIIYTDISRDGTMEGPNVEAIENIVNKLQIPVIASGGISSMEDIKRLLSIKGLWGAITGKAVYTGAIDLKEVIRLVSV